MFRTEIIPEASPVKINIKDPILTTGSCFSDAIGTKLFESKFIVLTNPFGVSYNPHSIHKTLRYALHNQAVPENTFAESQELFVNYDFHSSFSSLKKSEIENKIQETVSTAHNFLKHTKWIFITYGTAWVYERKDTGDIVSNCHKLPASGFTKSLLSQKKVLESFDVFYSDLKTVNPGCKLILTVSPVRHIKDTLPLNSVSKSVLRLACQTISETCSDVFYFPSYEIMLDDLRDYRFYKADMIHPSAEAEEYIWNKFSDSYFDGITKEFIKKWAPIHTSLQHKAFHAGSTTHQSFLRKTLSQLEELSKTVNVDNEIALLKSQLKS
ncbi:MAG TPA: GSCFA domain-containing protein [Cyclobacteriaceae bacterium]|nr:GSCFA domain-containing protein [Cyclobacteriaceae bacterium]